MIEIVQKGPFAGGVTAWRGRSGESVHTVVVKGTYDLAPLACILRDTPRPLTDREEVYEGSDPASGSVRIVADLVPWKRSAEVVVVGSAYAPHERAVPSIVARLVVGEVDKAIEAYGPRRFRADGTLEDPSLAMRVPLRLETSGRGIDDENAAGPDPTRPDARGYRVAPSIVPPAHRIERPDDDIPFIGFGPLSTAQRRRTAGLRAEDREWLADPNARRAPIGLDPDIYQVAPRDQRMETGFRPDTRLLLENLHPRHARLVTNLPGVGPRAVLLGPREEDIPLVADTMFIDTDEGSVCVTWRGYVSFDRAPPAAAILVMQAEPSATPFAGMPSMPNVLHVQTQRLTTMEMTQTDTDELHLGAQLNPLPFVRAEGFPIEDEITLATKKGQMLGDTGAFGKQKRPTKPPPLSAPPPRSAKQPPPPPPSRASAPPLPPREGPPPLPPPRASSPSLSRIAPSVPLPVPLPVPPPPPSPTGVAPAPVPKTSPPPPMPPMAPPMQPPLQPPPTSTVAPALQPPLQPPTTSGAPPLQPPMAPSGPTPMAPSGPTPMAPSGPTPMAPSGPTPMAPSGPTPMGTSGPSPMSTSMSGSMPAPLSAPMPAPMPPAPVSVRPPAPSMPLIPQPPPLAGSTQLGSSTPIGFVGSSSSGSLGLGLGSSTGATTSGIAASPTPSLAAAPAPVGPAPAKPAGNGAALFEAAFGAKSASDAAATREREKSEAGAKSATREPAADATVRRALVDLLAFDDKLPLRLRRDPVYSKVLAKGAPPKAFLFPDEPAAKQANDEGRGRWEVLRLLSVAAPLDAAQARDAISSGLDDDNQLEMPLLVIGGELRPTFDEVKTLEAAVQVAQPSSSANKALPPLLKMATDTAAGPWPPTREVTQHIVKQIEAAMTQSPNLPPRFFPTQLERVLLETRAYKKRTLFGAIRIRAELVFGSGSSAGDPIPIYLPDAANDLLPMLPAFPIVAAAELRPREDATETHSECLVVFALGRVVRRVR